MFVGITGPHRSSSRHRGFTLLELMVVIAMMAVVVGMVTLSLRDSDASTLDEEGVRLCALLEGARAQSRAMGREIRWQTTGSPNGFAFTGYPPNIRLPTQWLDTWTQAQVVGNSQLILGPEPVIGAQRVVLSLGQRQLVLATDGLGPFQPLDVAGAP